MRGRLAGPVLVAGAGLLGTSVGLAATRAGLEVYLSDTIEEHVRTASGLGAGRPWSGEPVQMAVVAVPPSAVHEQVVRHLAGTKAVVTDVCSIKSSPLAAVAAAVDRTTLGRYVGSHPMAGGERSGPLAASAALFDGRPWALTPHDAASPSAVRLVREMVVACGGAPVVLSPEEHDLAVARTSHLPHLLAVLAAGSLLGAPAEHLALSGQGVRDVTRVAAGEPQLWGQIVGANQGALTGLLSDAAARLTRLADAVARGSGADLEEFLDAGVEGTRLIPGKHGETVTSVEPVYVSVPDTPGGLARLFADTGRVGVNVEDVRIDHDPARPVGMVELSVAADQAEGLREALQARGWAAHR